MAEQSQNDFSLVKQAQHGDELALVALYEKYLPSIYRFCYSQCGHRQTAEDLTSDVFMKMVKQLYAFRFQSSFKNWLYAIAKRTVADYWRQHYHAPVIALEEHHAATSATPTNDHDLEMETLTVLTEEKADQILNSLPMNYRVVLECRFIRNMTIAETASTLHESETNIKVLQHRALKKAYELWPPL